MRQKAMTSFLLGVGMLAVAGISFAETMPAKPGNPESGVDDKVSPKRATGQVTSVQAKAGKLEVKTSDQELSLNVPASATKKVLESIKVGDMVDVSFRDLGGILVADAVSKSGTMAGAGASRLVNPSTSRNH